MSNIDVIVNVDARAAKQALDDATKAVDTLSQELMGMVEAMDQSSKSSDGLNGAQKRFGQGLKDSAVATAAGEEVARRYKVTTKGLIDMYDPLISKENAVLQARKLQADAARVMADVTARDAAAKARAQQDTDRFTKATLELANAIGKTRAQLLQEEADLRGVGNEMRGAIEAIGKADELKAAGNEMEGFSLKTAGAKRELLVLGHELSQGRYKNFAGSLLVLGERTNIMGAAMRFAASPAGLLGIAITALGAASAYGAYENEKFKDSLVVTGNFANLNIKSFENLSASVEKLTGGSIGQAREAIKGLADTGKFTGDSLTAAAAAVVDLQLRTGKATDEIVKDFVSMKGNVYRWAVEHNDSMHFANNAQLDHIKKLEESGQASQAMVEVLKLVSAEVRKNAEDYSFLGSVMHSISTGFSDIIDWAKHLNSSGDHVTEMTARVKRLNAEIARTDISAPSDTVKEKYRTELKDLEKRLLVQSEAESKAATRLGAKSDADDAFERINKQIGHLVGNAETAKEAFENLKKSIDVIRQSPDPSKDQRALLADFDKNPKKYKDAIDKAHNRADTKSGNKLQTAIDDERSKLGEQKAKLDDEIGQLEKYQKVLNDSSEAEVNFITTKGKLRDASQPIKDEFLAQAKAIDGSKEKVKGMTAAYAELDTIQKNSVHIQDQISQWKIYGGAVDKSRVAIVDSMISLGMFKGATEQQIQDLKDAAKAEDEFGKALAAEETVAGFKNRIKAIEDETDALGKLGNATQRAKDLRELDRKQAVLSKDDYESLKKGINDASDAFDKKSSGQAAGKLTQMGDTAVRNLKEEISLVYRTSMERKALTEVLKIQAKAEEDLAKITNPEDQQKIRDEAAKQIARINSEFAEADKLTASFAWNSNKAFSSIAHDAADSSSQIQAVWKNTFQALEDSMAAMLQNGTYDWKNFSKTIENEITHILIRKALIDPIASSFAGDPKTGAGGFTDVVSSGFSYLRKTLGFAAGGMPPVGQVSVVGEKGPEVFVPTQSGAIIPNHLLGGGSGGSNVTVNVIEDSSRAGQQQTRQGKNGQPVIDMFVQQVKAAIASDIHRGDGLVPAAISRTYGLGRSAGAY